jgi:plastocyanin
MKSLLATALFATTALACTAASADEYTLTLKEHHFTPESITLPAHQKVELTVTNLQTSPAEFESEDLDREKVVGAGKSIVVKLGPLTPGTYDFVDDFHRDSKGTIVVK